MKVRYIGSVGVDMPTLGVGAAPGEVLDLPEDVVAGLGDDFERLEEVAVHSSKALTVSDFEVVLDPKTQVSRASAGSVIFADGTEYVWPEDGSTITMRREHAELLAEQYPDGFGFDGTVAPEQPAPVVTPAPDAAPAADAPAPKNADAPAPKKTTKAAPVADAVSADAGTTSA